MVPAELSIPCDATSCGDVELDIAPDPDVEVRQRLPMEEPDQVDERQIGAGEWFGIGQGAC